MNIRLLEENDKDSLRQSLASDLYHGETSVDFFYDPRTQCNVYEEEGKPIFWVRGAPAMRVDIQFSDNKDFRKNRKALLEGFPSFAERAKKAGFAELIFNSSSPLLIAFCKKHFGFHHSQGELRKFL